jgi:DNA-binding response OmpR family regulator
MEARPRILVVEDDPDLARMLSRFLAIRYEVEVAGDGEAGLAALLRPPPPDLLITDVNMPKLNGYQMVRKMRHHLGDARPPVIFLSARERPLDVIAGIRAGARHYLTKPFKLDALEAKVRGILG